MVMASTASDSSPPSPVGGAPGSAAFLDDHALFLDHDQSTSSSFFPAATTATSQEPLLAPASASSSAAARKPPRKRPRASRRPPTTVVTTDTANFRAMVQEFTGIPAPPPFAPLPHLGPGVFFGAPHDLTAVAGTGTGTRAPLELLMRPSPLKLPTAPHAAASPPAPGSFAHSLFASSSGPSSDPYYGGGGFAPTLSGAVPRYDGGGFDVPEDERVLEHGHHGLFSSFLHAGDRYHHTH